MDGAGTRIVVPGVTQGPLRGSFWSWRIGAAEAAAARGSTSSPARTLLASAATVEGMDRARVGGRGARAVARMLVEGDHLSSRLCPAPASGSRASPDQLTRHGCADVQRRPVSGRMTTGRGKRRVPCESVPPGNAITSRLIAVARLQLATAVAQCSPRHGVCEECGSSPGNGVRSPCRLARAFLARPERADPGRCRPRPFRRRATGGNGAGLPDRKQESPEVPAAAAM